MKLIYRLCHDGIKLEGLLEFESSCKVIFEAEGPIPQTDQKVIFRPTASDIVPVGLGMHYDVTDIDQLTGVYRVDHVLRSYDGSGKRSTNDIIAGQESKEVNVLITPIYLKSPTPKLEECLSVRG